MSHPPIQDTNAAKIFYDEVANILERAIGGVLSRNALLYFAFADFEEGRLKYERVHLMYNKFLEIPEIDPTLVSRSTSLVTFTETFTSRLTSST